MQSDNYNSSRVILHLIDTTGPGGAETVFIQLADRLRKLGNQSIVVIRGEGWVCDQLKSKGISPIIIPAQGSFAFGFLMQLTQVIRTNKVDIIQSHLLGSNVYASIAGLLTSTPVVATYHGMVDINPNERFKWLKNKVMQFGISHYIAVSFKLLENIKEQGLLVPKKASVVYNGVDIERYKSTKSDRLRNKLLLPEDAVLIGSLGNIRLAKGYPVLIDSAAKLLKKNPNLHFVIAGHKKEKLMKPLLNQLEKYQIAEHFHFIGFTDNSSEFLSQIDLFVLSSTSEGFSISTIEAMASALPVIVTRCGGPEEIVTHGENAIMVDVNNSCALANGISKLLNNQELAMSLGSKARKHVTEIFSLDKMLDSYAKIYDGLVVE